MASNSSVMSRIQMFEKKTASSDVGTPTPPKYKRQSPGSEPPKKSNTLADSSQSYSYTPPVKTKSDAGAVRSFTPSPIPTPPQGNREVEWPSPDASGGSPSSKRLLPSQLKKSFQAKKASPQSSAANSITSVSSNRSVLSSRAGQQVRGSSPPSNGVQESRNTSSTVDKPTPVQSKRRKEQEASPLSQEVEKPNSAEVGWPSPEDTKDEGGFRKEPLVQVPIASSNQESSFSQDENEAPKSSTLPAKEARAASPKGRPRLNLIPHHPSNRSMGSRSAASTTESTLKRNLNDASVVMRDERESSIGSASSSQRSSLSVDELMSIALNAIRASRAANPPKPVSAVEKPKKSPRDRRKRYQRYFQAAETKDEGESTAGSVSDVNNEESESTFTSVSDAKKDENKSTAKDAEEAKGVAPAPQLTKSASEARIAVLTAAKSKIKTRSSVTNQVNGGPDARSGSMSRKKSRYDLFETARQRAGSRTPSPVMMDEPAASSEGGKSTTADAQTDPHPEKEYNSRLAILSAGRRKLSTGSPASFGTTTSQKGGATNHRRQSSTDTSGAESNDTADDSTVSRREKRTARMAVLAATHRSHSPVPRTVNEADAKSKEPSNAMPKPVSSTTTRMTARRSHSPVLRTANKAGATSKEPSNAMLRPVSSTKTKISTNSNGRPAIAKNRSSRLLELASSTRSPSPLLMRNPSSEAKDSEKLSESGNKARKKAVPKEAALTETPLSSRKEAFEKAALNARSSPIKTLSTPPGRERHLNVSGEFVGEPSPTGSAFSSTSASFRVSEHPALLAKKGASPARSERSKSSHHAPESITLKSSPYGRLHSDAYRAATKPSDQSPESTTTSASGRLRGDVNQAVAKPSHQNPESTTTSAPGRLRGDVNKAVAKPSHHSPESTTTSAPGRLHGDVYRPVAKPSPQSPESTATTAPGRLHGDVYRPVAKSSNHHPESCTAKASPSEHLHGDGYKAAVALSTERPTDLDDSWRDVPARKQDVSSETLSSPGGVRAAIDAWSSKSKESKIAETNPTSVSPRLRGWRSNDDQHIGHSETKPTVLPADETNAVSSETSVGGSHASTFVSSPSSYASSRMSVGAPGSFFRPMAPVSDYEGTTNDHIMLGQLSADTDEESSALPSHLFRSTSDDDRSKQSGDTELSFLLEQMQTETSRSDDSDIRLLTVDEPASGQANGKDSTDQSTLFGQYHVKSSSEDNSSTTDHRTAGTTENEQSSLLGQSLLDLEGNGFVPRTIAEIEEPTTDDSRSQNSADSLVIKWWQNPDPLKRQQEFESQSKNASGWPAASTSAWGVVTKRGVDDDLFSGLSGDDASKKSESKQSSADSCGDDIFSGVNPSMDSSEGKRFDSSLIRNAEMPACPPPPPPPPLETSSSDQFGTILVHGSQAVDSVGSDITSSVLGSDFPKDPIDWRRHEAHAVITEELTAEIEDEEDTVKDEEDLSEHKHKESSDHPGKSHETYHSEPIEQHLSSPCSGGVLEIDVEEADHDSVVESESLRGDSIFMSLGKFMDSFALCGAPGK